MFADTSSAVRLKDFGSAARSDRYSHRRACGEVQGAGKRHSGGELAGDPRTGCKGATGSTGALLRRANLLQRADVAEVDSGALRDRCGVERASRERDHPAGVVCACLRSNLESEPHTRRSGGEGKHRARPRERSNSVPNVGSKLLGVTLFAEGQIIS